MNNGKICVSVCAETASELIEKIERPEKNADVIELRFDYLSKNELNCLDLKQLDSVMNRIFAVNPPKPLLTTLRSKEQGGKHGFTSLERENFWNMGYDGGWADLEEDMIDYSWGWLWEQRICSYHDFKGVPENLFEIYQRLKREETNVIKIAVQANDTTDGLMLMKLLKRAKAEKKELIPIAMGEHGIWTRILGLSRGAFMTFASLDDESATAPGQLTAQEMIETYRVKELDENTEIYGLVAGSIAHSVSPQMHNAAFKFHNLNAVYVPFAVKNLEEFMRRMIHPKTREIDWNLRGLSVTIPHKIEIMKYLDFVDETATQIGAVNTVKMEGDKLLGFNTDAIGFIEPLKNSFGNLKNSHVAVFGAGGAARAVVYALKNEGANITVFARDLEKAKILERDFGVNIDNLINFGSRTINYEIVVNATPLGTKKGGLENETPATAEQLEGVGLVYDLVYNPFETRLIKEAQTVFVPTIGGLAMLVAQATEQQKIWTGLDAPVKEMSAAALKKLSRKN